MAQASTETYHLHILGQVQGVGFRPFVWRLAREHGLSGWVNNTTDGVHVVFNAGAPLAEAFAQTLLAQAPKLAIITAHHLETIEAQAFTGFHIVHSSGEAKPNLLLTPDFALCADCRRELHDPANRRYRYPFITCTNCGPRFSIATGLPYDRERTTMQPFDQCPDCRQEYNDPADRRYFSQTNSCPTCGIALRLSDNTGESHTPPLETAVEWLRQGKILAVKGIGGYLLMCDATNAGAIQLLRTRKHRPTKPFALLYPGLELLETDAYISENEKQLLSGPEAPILLVPLRQQLDAAAEQHTQPDSGTTGICHNLIAPGLDQIGVMLPYAPLLDLLARDFGKPLVATSANISGSPIVYTDEAAQTQLLGIADGILSHNRDIAIPQDDSVQRFSPRHRHKITLRRSRGYSPTLLITPNSPQSPIPNPQSTLALGATLKSTFAWQHQGNIYLSQYLGDLESFDTQEAFEHTLRHFLGLLRSRPGALVVDKHPEYFSTQLGRRLAAEWDIPVREVQHHKAHFAAVLAEHGYLIREQEMPVLGVIWDGTGYGDDGQVWGGEFFRFDGQSIERVGHFEPFLFFLGDKMPREPRLSAMSMAHGLDGSAAVLENKFSPQEWALYGKMLSRGTGLHTTSVGRLFDGVASLLGLADRVSYEGEAAMLLEQTAMRFFQREGLSGWPPFLPEAVDAAQVPTSAIVGYVLETVKKGIAPERIAADFHRMLIETIRQQARRNNCRVLAFSGGVWQNALLVDLALQWLQPEYRLLFPRELSPNDEGVSFGQLMLA